MILSPCSPSAPPDTSPQANPGIIVTDDHQADGDESDSEQTEWVVSKLHGVRYISPENYWNHEYHEGDQIQYFVKYLGYRKKSWQPLADLREHALQSIIDFHERSSARMAPPVAALTESLRAFLSIESAPPTQPIAVNGSALPPPSLPPEPPHVPPVPCFAPQPPLSSCGAETLNMVSSVLLDSTGRIGPWEGADLG